MLLIINTLLKILSNIVVYNTIHDLLLYQRLELHNFFYLVTYLIIMSHYFTTVEFNKHIVIFN